MNDDPDCHPTPRLHRLRSLEQWRKNQIAVTVSASFVFFGFTLVMPFLPLYVRQLGVQGTGAIAFWTGLILSVSPAMAALSGPIWGRVGDRVGLKAMAVRATAVNCLCWFMMAFAANVWHLLLLRALLGLLGGFNSVSIAAITQLSPRDKMARVIGTLQATQILGAAVGPVVGGILAGYIGIQNTFFATAVLMFGSFLSIMLLYRDSERKPSAKTGESPGPALDRSFLKHPEYLMPLVILFVVHMTHRTYAPIIPLFLEQLGTPAARLAAVAGAMFSMAAFGEALSSWLSGRLASRVPIERLILVRLSLGLAVLIPIALVGSSSMFFILRVTLALLAGGILTLAFTSAGHVIPPEHRGTGFSILSSVSLLGGSAGPIIAGALAALSIRAVFVFNIVVYVLLIAFMVTRITQIKGRGRTVRKLRGLNLPGLTYIKLLIIT